MEICPKCHGIMKPISERTGGFSVGKAAIGAVIAGPMGVAAGALGKKKVQYQCEHCGYIIEKNAPKDQQPVEQQLRPSSYQTYGYGAAAHSVASSLTNELTAQRKGIYGISSWRDIISVVSGKNHLVGLRANGTVVAAGNNDLGQCNVEQWRDIKSIVAGPDSTYGLVNDGTVIATGDNSYRQCDVSGWRNIREVISGGRFAFGLTNDGHVVSTPYANQGKYNLEEEVKTWHNIVAIASNRDNSIGRIVGLKEDGTVVVAGTKQRNENTDSWRNIIAIAEGDSHTVGLKSDGTVVACGGYGFGECNVSSWRDIVAVWAGLGLTVGLKADGTIVSNGNVTIEEVADPTKGLQMPTYDDIVNSIGAGGRYELENRGSYSNLTQYLEIGDALTSQRYGLVNIKNVSIGTSHVVFLKDDGTVIAFGNSRVCDVLTWNNVVSICANYSLTIGVKSDGTIIAIGRGSKISNPDVSTWPSTPCPQIAQTQIRSQQSQTEQQGLTPKPIFSCPKCGNVVRYGDPDCPKCGQIFEWSKLQ